MSQRAMRCLETLSYTWSGTRSEVRTGLTVYAPAERPALEALAATGVERAIFPLPSEPRDATLPRLDAYATVMQS